MEDKRTCSIIGLALDRLYYIMLKRYQIKSPFLSVRVKRNLRHFYKKKDLENLFKKI